MIKGNDMPRNKKHIEPIPDHFSSIEEASEFWDSHSLADYWDQTREVHFDVEIAEEPKYITLESKLAKKIHEVAKQQKISAETLVNLWIAEKLSAI
jgi:hypothetical protein